MSIQSVLDRIAQLEALTSAPVQPAPQTTTAAPATSFADQLARAATPAAATTVATPTPTPATQTLATPPPLLAVPPAAPTTSTSTPYGDEIAAAAAQNGVDPNLIRAVIQQESGFNASAVSAAGAQGLMQLMPSTAAGLGVTNPFDPAQAIQGGTRYLREQLDRFGGDVSLALAAYNAGPDAVSRFGGVPPYGETQTYVQRVLANYQAFSSQPTTTERSPL